MALLNKKKENKEAIKRDYSFKVTVLDALGEAPREVDTFLVKKTRSDDNVVSLVNEDKGFDVFVPYDNMMDLDTTIQEVEKKLKKLKKIYAEYKQGKRKDNINPLNVLDKIILYEKYKQQLTFKGGSFIKYDKDGTPHFLFFRHRSVFVPFKWNLSMAHIHAPVEPLIKEVILSRDEKKRKHLHKNDALESFAKALGWIVLIVGFIANIVWSNILYNKTNDNAMVKLENRIDTAPLVCAELYGKAGDNFLEASEKAKSTFDEMQLIANPEPKKIDTTPKQEIIQ